MRQDIDRTIVFLDLDDVICLNETTGGYNALQLFTEASRKNIQVDSKHPIWEKLFDKSAKKNLQSVHEEFSLQYVLSTSWRWFFDKPILLQTLRLCGLDFVADNLHQDWSTPQISRQAHRAVEINSWLAVHPEHANQWVVLDDELSGTGFNMWGRDRMRFVILCQPQVGLQQPELARLKWALKIRNSSSGTGSR